ncbi:hypothetical protein [Desulfogranum marinum]|jgi:hypothetical protein|uniref:hypothetical protein n=1 Tax=Desulfogranum marinum TaxID=453220 RepID=UPI0029C8F13C|nr:hypothetical protein [Desulfogranum marinum]
MTKKKHHTVDAERFAKCQICLNNIPVEYYFNKGDEIICYECGTEYTLISKSPVKLEMSGDYYEQDDYFGEMHFDDY